MKEDLLKSYDSERRARDYAQQQTNMLANKGLSSRAEISIRYATGERLPWQVWAVVK